MSSNHNQPWTWGFDGHGGISVDDKDGRQVAFVRHAKQDKAALIAAAPDLLEACKWLLGLPGVQETDPGAAQSAREAIAKAEGA